jgi:hypothetical protein
MALIVRAFPLAQGRSAADVTAFANALATERQGDARNFYQRFGITHESWHVQETPSGPWVIGVTRVGDAETASANYAASNEQFDLWFKNQVMHISGVDPTQQPLGPPTTQIFQWSDDRVPNSNLCA